MFDSFSSVLTQHAYIRCILQEHVELGTDAEELRKARDTLEVALKEVCYFVNFSFL
jgi:hypothetical protein